VEIHYEIDSFPVRQVSSFFDAKKEAKKGSRQRLPLLPTQLCAGNSTILPN